MAIGYARARIREGRICLARCALYASLSFTCFIICFCPLSFVYSSFDSRILLLFSVFYSYARIFLNATSEAHSKKCQFHIKRKLTNLWVWKKKHEKHKRTVYVYISRIADRCTRWWLSKCILNFLKMFKQNTSPFCVAGDFPANQCGFFRFLHRRLHDSPLRLFLAGRRTV